MAEKIVFIDIDHTIAAAWWRDSRMSDWDEYHELSAHDDPIREMIALVQALRNDNWVIIGLTGRPEKWQRLTMDWCLKYGAMLDQLIMRPDNNYETAPDFKLAAVLDVIQLLDDPMIIVFEDRDDVVALLKSNVKCVICQVSTGDNNGEIKKAQTGSYCPSTKNEPNSGTSNVEKRTD